MSETTTQQEHLGKTEKALPAVANQPQEPEPSRDATERPRKPWGKDARERRLLLADVARVAHWLMNDSGYTREHAAGRLADIVRRANKGVWWDEELTTLLGDAAALPRVTNLPPTREPADAIR